MQRTAGEGRQRRSGSLLKGRSPQGIDEWLRLLEQRHPTAIDLGLERCTEVWRRMGSPRPAPQIITVAGTNGKGSTVATACSLLQALGYRQGAYTSPHILRFNERATVNGEELSSTRITDAFEVVEAARERTSLTYFEFTTLALFYCLSRAQLDVAVLEVGLGGRLDAVNMVDADCAVITPIGLDHQEYLGHDREAIGAEKAGIMRRGQPVVISDRTPPDSVTRRATELECPTWQLGQNLRVDRFGAEVSITVDEQSLTLPAPVLPGAHQLDNLAAAVAAVKAILPRGAFEPGQVPALAEGVLDVRLAGRMQQVGDDPEIWVDVGHNPLAAGAIAAELSRQRQENPDRRISLVLGMLRDKDAAEFSRQLHPHIAHWLCAGLTGDRGQSGDHLARQIQSVLGDASIETHPDVPSALDAARARCKQTGGVIWVVGSFLAVSEAMLQLGDADRIPISGSRHARRKGQP